MLHAVVNKCYVDVMYFILLFYCALHFNIFNEKVRKTIKKIKGLT